ncbi:hypothetical protein [Legionella hackeliae]|uniref:Uncharacterized protein n=1 Tax=Legionella hackeliae TaxID=449 RepID=A0A0A8USS8_LEGHA|nr:hypothetical protein [Legionella hackeliae]KTD10591.1 hypothetical protein Lhac_2959 [Legionella hackeliae]CEK10097.1 protein of unknown function [Legionella hackeliae]STX46822.1 Uncharacterised protein [Legionella hackeliae]
MAFFNETKRQQLVIIFFIILTVLAAAFFLYSVYLHRHIINTYELSFRKWQSQQLDNYTLEYNGDCLYTVSVKQGIQKAIKKTATSDNLGCEFIPAWLGEKQPMHALFAQLINSPIPHCGANGCSCDYIDWFTIRFDKKLGYINYWKSINSGPFIPYITVDFPFITKYCHLMYTKPINFTVNIRPLE